MHSLFLKKIDVKHPEIFNLDLNSINLSQFGNDENKISDASESGDWYEEHSFKIANPWFDKITLRVWEHDNGKPEYVWLFKQDCSIRELRSICKELETAYGVDSISSSNPITETTTWHYENRKYVSLDFQKREKPELTVTFRYSTKDKSTGES